ncbi:MAG: glycosyltransferase [Candidatus Omnitrophota bacterium]
MKQLKIYVCLISEDQNNLWHQHLTKTLLKMGHKVFTPGDVGLLDAWRFIAQGFSNRRHMERTTENILAEAKKIHAKEGIDLFFAYLYPFQFRPRLFKELTKLGIPSVYFFCDNFTHKDVAREYAPYATLNWVPESEAIPQFKSSGSKYIYLPMAANPDIFYPVDTEETVDISFLGSKNPYRRYILGRALHAGLNLRVYGGFWCPDSCCQSSEAEHKANIIERCFTHVRFKKNSISRFLRYGLGPVRRSRWYNRLGEEYDKVLQGVSNREPLDIVQANSVYSFSAVSIGTNDLFDSLLERKFIFYTKMRNFEAAMAGACFLMQATPDGHELFQDGEEVMFYSTPEELIDKANFLLRNESVRKTLRLAARKRALLEHTWSCRFKKVFSALEIG